MDAAAHLIMAMHDRLDRIASALWDWLQRHEWNTEQLTDYLDCSTATLERLALVPRPRPGADWDDDIEIIAVSLHINHMRFGRSSASTSPSGARVRCLSPGSRRQKQLHCVLPPA